MKNTVLSFNNAVSNRHEPREYSYQREHIPLGTYEVSLNEFEIGFVPFKTKLKVTVELRGQRSVNLKEVVVV